MTNRPFLHTDTPLSRGLFSLLTKLADRIGLATAERDEPVRVYLAGGMAVHLYTGVRVTTDIDAEFGARIMVPEDLIIEITLQDGTQQPVYFDTNYNPMFALMHENYQIDAIEIKSDLNGFCLMALSPLDLAVSKMARFADNDREDILALSQLKLFTHEQLEDRALQALSGFIGGQSLIKINIREAVELVQPD